MNVLLFQGKTVIQEKEIEQVLVRESYPKDEVLKERERDIFKLWKKSILLGIENQSRIEKDMIFRVLLYDGISYINQKGNKKPIITIVLYYGKERWDKHKNI